MRIDSRILLLWTALAAAPGLAIDIRDFHVDLQDTRHSGIPHLQIETPTGSLKYYIDGRPMTVGGRTPPHLGHPDWERIFNSQRWRQQILNASKDPRVRNSILTRVAPVLRRAAGTGGRLARGLMRQALRVLGAVTVGAVGEVLFSPSSAYAAEGGDYCRDALNQYRTYAWDTALLLETRAETTCLLRHVLTYNTSVPSGQRGALLVTLNELNAELRRAVDGTGRSVAAMREYLQRECVDRPRVPAHYAAEVSSLRDLHQVVNAAPYDETCNAVRGTMGTGTDTKQLLEEIEEPSATIEWVERDRLPTLGRH